MVNPTREATTRDKQTRAASWKPPELLPVPDPQPGVSFRWIRVSSRGSIDNRNVSKRFREGWEPVAAKDHPELQFLPDRGSEFKDGVEIGGLLLCKTATENVKARNQHFAGVAQDQMASVDQSYLREANNPLMPAYSERKSRTTFGSGGE